MSEKDNKQDTDNNPQQGNDKPNDIPDFPDVIGFFNQTEGKKHPPSVQQKQIEIDIKESNK